MARVLPIEIVVKSLFSVKGHCTMDSTMGWLAWLVIGAIAGWLASIVMKTNRRQGLLLDIVVGIVGALLGGFVFNALGAPGVTGFNIWSLFVAFVGAIVLLGLLRMVTGRRAI
jgi:uncharacterized membrane protein YeaQ/YmgE (transglycosylase-associated protein family)